MNWKLPNILTASRLPLAAGFFVFVGLYSSDAPEMNRIWVTTAFVIFVIAGVTDFLDGFLARRMKIVSAFGRIVDPFVDKVLIVGSFAMLAGSNYMLDGSGAYGDFERGLPTWLTGGMASAVQPWMVVVVLAREFIISAVRGYSESQGIKFPATYAGKIKLFVQVVAIGTVLIQVTFVRNAEWAVLLKIAVVWLTVLVTVVSGLAYVNRARGLLVAD